MAAMLALPLFMPLHTADAAGAKKIVVDMSDQRVYAYEGNTLVFAVRMNARGTRGGTSRIRNKIPMATSFALGWKLPLWMGIYRSGGLENGFHAAAINRGGGRASTTPSAASSWPRPTQPGCTTGHAWERWSWSGDNSRMPLPPLRPLYRNSNPCSRRISRSSTRWACATRRAECSSQP